MNIFRHILSLCILLLFSLLNGTAFASTPEASAYEQDNAEGCYSTAYVCGQTVGTGCVLATVPMTHGLDTYQTGWRKLITGEHHATVGAQGLMGLGLSETNAELLYGAMALSSEVLAARALLKITSNPVVTGLGGGVDDVALATNRTQLIDDLVAGGTRITPENVVDIRSINGRTVWLETGNSRAGFPTSALPGNPTTVRVLEEHFGTTFQSVTGPENITSIMTNAGDGARGIVFGSRGPNEVGHVFNVINQNGTIQFLDGQTGTAANLNSGYQQFFLLPTN